MEEVVNIIKIGADYRDYMCAKCDKECNPAIRYTYLSKKLRDKYGNSILDGTFELCEKCAKKFK